MKLKIAAIGIIFTILFGITLTDRSSAQETVSIDIFYQELSPHGGWSPHPEFGDVWQPYEFGPDWKPYTDGRWEWSNQGWIWISYEPWGWATYHYGRWVYDDYQGWLWIPGTTWAPAWVSWQQSPEYIGWSPLPPDRGFFLEIGFVFNSYKSNYYKPYKHHKHHKKHYKRHRYYHDYYNNPHHYKPPARHSVFLPHNKFGHHKHAGKAALAPPHYDVVLRNSRNVTNIKRVNNKVINYGPDKHYIEKRSNRKLVSHKIVDRKNYTIRGKKNVNIVKGGTYNVYRPKIERGNRDPFTTNRNQINKHSPNRKNINNRSSHQQKQLNRQAPKTDLHSSYKYKNRISETSRKTGVSKSKEIGNNPTITNRKISKLNQRQNISQNKVNTNSERYNKYSYKNRTSQKPKLLQKGFEPKTQNFKGNKISSQKQNPRYSTTNRSNQYRQSNRQNNKSNQISQKKVNKKNYSTKNKKSAGRKSKVSQTRSNKPNIRTKQIPQNPAFSRR